MMSKNDFLGTTVNGVFVLGDQNSKTPFKSVFFKPYTSTVNVVGRTTSIVTDSLLLGGFTAYIVLLTGWELLKAIGNLVTGNLEDAKENAGEIGGGALAIGMLLIAAIISPVVNTVDLVGGAGNTIKSCFLNSQEEESNYSPS